MISFHYQTPRANFLGTDISINTQGHTLEKSEEQAAVALLKKLADVIGYLSQETCEGELKLIMKFGSLSTSGKISILDNNVNIRVITELFLFEKFGEVFVAQFPKSHAEIQVIATPHAIR